MLSPREIPIAGGDSIDLMSGALRFLRSVRSRLPLVILTLIVCVSLGAFYYVTAERKYESSAKLMILQMGGDVIDKDGHSNQGLQDKMPDFEHILTGDSTIKETLRNLPDDHRIDFAGVRQDRWLAAFRSKLSVSTIRKTSIMSVSFRSKDPTTAYAVVEEVLNSFIGEVNRIHQDERSEDMKLLTQQRESTERELETKQAELLQLQSETKEIFGTGDKSVNVLIDRILKLNQDWILKSTEASEFQALLTEMEAAQLRNEDLSVFLNRVDPALASKINEKRSGVDSGGSFVTNKLQDDLTKAQAQLEDKLTFLGERHPEIQRIRNEIAVKTRQLQERPQTVDELLNAQDIGSMLLQRVRRDSILAANTAQRMRETLEQESAAASQKSGLFASVEAKGQEVFRLRDYLAVLADRMKSARLGQSNSIRAKVTVEPEIDKTPVTPRLAMTLLSCVILGISISFGLIYIHDLIDDRFHSPDDLRRELGSPVLAMVRKLHSLEGLGLASLYPYAKPNAIESEAFRTLRTAIEFSPEETRRATITSTEPGDGKTTIVASLAVAFAQTGKRTLLIDGDMRRPGLTRMLELAGREGLSTILKDSSPVGEVAERVVSPTLLPNLHVLAAGPKPLNPVELLAGERLAELIAWADSRYDQILIDAPPSLAVADVQIIGRVVDGAILVVRPDTNHRRMVIRATESMTALGCPLLGIVVNQIQHRSGDEYGYGYGYGYGGRAVYGYDQEEDPPIDIGEDVASEPDSSDPQQRAA